jgi:DMSO/TMAO reductase YedYZ molybdopterin-dependent catalytic subunit
LIGLVPLHGDRPRATPFGELLGGPGLDARRFTDLSKLQPQRLVTPTDEMFVRTAAPPGVKVTPPTWTIAVRGFGEADPAIPVATLRDDARPMGAHLIECSGNVDPDNFGLMSVTEWEGVPLADLVARLRRSSSGHADATAVLVSGYDATESSRSSAAGASWVFPLDGLERLGAFLAVRMNGAPLTPDHGAPVRLVVPGWYGCSWIKWVNELRLVSADEPTTSQMIEFSRRTHQDGIPKLARDYQPPVIDLAATPIRVEKRRIAGRIEYRVVGVVWGGDRPADQLLIRFNPADQPKPLTICPPPPTHRTWSLWDYRWRPESTGTYNIALRAADPAIRTRRLDLSFYVRRVVIDEVGR